MWFTTLVTTGALAMVHPLLPIVLSYDYYLLLGATAVLNRTAATILLSKTKRHVYLNKLNFLGFEREESRQKINLKEIRYLGPYENKFITMHHMGLLPSMQKHFTRSAEQSRSETGDFRHFIEFAA